MKRLYIMRRYNVPKTRIIRTEIYHNPADFWRVLAADTRDEYAIEIDRRVVTGYLVTLATEN